MSIPIRCPACAAEYHVKPALAGKRVKCKSCGGPIRVAAPGTPPAAAPDAAARARRPAPAASCGAPPAAKPASGVKPVPVAKPPPAKSAPKAAAPSPGKPKKKRPPSSYLYMAVAGLAVVAFGLFVFRIGREVGLWGEIRRTTVRVVPLTPEQRLENNRRASAANLVRIGQALELYARFHKGMFPKSFRQTLEVADLPADAFDSPFSVEEGAGPPRGRPGGAGAPAPGTPSDFAYLYFRSMGRAMPDDTVVAYDAAALEHAHATNALYASGNVKWLTRDELAAEIDRCERRRIGLPSAPDGAGASAAPGAGVAGSVTAPGVHETHTQRPHRPPRERAR